MEKPTEQVMKGWRSHVITLPESRRSLQLVFSLTSALVPRHPRLAQSEWEVVSMWRLSEVAGIFKVKDTYQQRIRNMENEIVKEGEEMSRW